jgi:palmitoyltransferase
MKDITDRRGFKDYCNFRWCIMSIMVYIVMGLLVWAEYVFVRHVCFTLVPSRFSFQFIFYMIGWHILLILTATSYLRCVFTDPGSVPIGIDIHTYEKDAQNNVRKCDVCKNIKPDRAHHCSTCRACVLKMDHHCPWVNNCVGWRNYKFFVLFLFYTTLLSLFYAVCTAPFMFSIDFQKLQGEQLQVVIVMLVSLAFGLGLLCFTGQHVSLAMSNKTTLESFDRNMNNYNPYDIGKMKNWSQVFGNKPILWFLPVISYIGNGYEYERKEGDIEAGERLL